MIALVLYAALCGLVFAWGREIYGVPGALAATVLGALLLFVGRVHPVTTDAATAALLFASMYALARCFLDASLQAALLAGVALGAAQLVGCTVIELYPPAALMLGVRVATAERTESRRRVLHAGVVSLLVAAVTAVLVTGIGGAVRGPGRPRVLVEERDAASGVRHDAQRELSGARLDGSGGVLRTLPLLALLLIRPWRRRRRYTDLILLTLVAWLLLVVGDLSRLPEDRSFLPIYPFLALLAGANWDYARAHTWRVVASLLLALQSIATLLPWLG